MAQYECTLITRPEISSADVEKLGDKFADVISTNGGKVKKREYWGLRNLAFRINKQKKGHYLMLGVESPAEGVAELRRKLELDDDVLRNLIIKVENLNEEPTAMLKAMQQDEA